MITTAQISNLLLPGLNEVIGEYNNKDEPWKHIFTVRKSYQAQERIQEMQYLSMGGVVSEGANIPLLSMSQRVLTTVSMEKVAVGFTITQEALDDNLYKSQFPQQIASCINSLIQTKNTLGTNILNNAFNAAYPVGDGQPMCSTIHPIAGGTGTFSNSLTPGGIAIDFSEAGLETAIIAIQRMPDQAGLLVGAKANKLIIPPSLQFAASRILNSIYSPNNANNAINAINHGDYFPGGYKVNQYLTSSTAWFILTDIPGMVLFQREEVKKNIFPVHNNTTTVVLAWERYKPACINPRAIFGSAGI